MKKIQILRFMTQLMSLIFIGMSFFIDFKIGIIVIFVTTIFLGAFSCGWICPYGFMQDIFSKIGDFIGIKKRKMPRIFQKVLVFTRYVLLGIVLMVTLDIIFNIAALDPRVNFQAMVTGEKFKISAFTILSIFLIISLFFERPFCNYLCIEGAKQGAIGIFRIFTVKRDCNLCVNCKKCDKACPMNISISKTTNLRSPQCIDCLKCVSACPVEGALKFGLIKFEKLELKKYISILSIMMILLGGYKIYNFITEQKLLEDNKPVIENKAIVNDSQTVEEDALKGIGEGIANGVADGVYTGEGEGFRGTVSVEVTVKDNLISSIEIIDNVDDRKWFDRASNSIPNRIIEAQSTDIDLVSGATYSSIGIRDAVLNAIEKALSF